MPVLDSIHLKQLWTSFQLPVYFYCHFSSFVQIVQKKLHILLTLHHAKKIYLHFLLQLAEIESSYFSCFSASYSVLCEETNLCQILLTWRNILWAADLFPCMAISIRNVLAAHLSALGEL